MGASKGESAKGILFLIFWVLIIGWLLGLSSEERHKALDWADPSTPVYTDPETLK